MATTLCFIVVGGQIAASAAAAQKVFNFDQSTRNNDEMVSVTMRPGDSFELSCPDATTNPPDALQASGQYCVFFDVLPGRTCGQTYDYNRNPYVTVSNSTGTSATFSPLGQDPGAFKMMFSCTRKNDGLTTIFQIGILPPDYDPSWKDWEVRTLKRCLKKPVNEEADEKCQVSANVGELAVIDCHGGLKGSSPPTVMGPAGSFCAKPFASTTAECEEETPWAEVMTDPQIFANEGVLFILNSNKKGKPVVAHGRCNFWKGGSLETAITLKPGSQAPVEAPVARG